MHEQVALPACGAPWGSPSGSVSWRNEEGAPPANAGEAEVKKFYQFLADWEKQHLEALRTLYNSVRTDFFAAGSFSPF